MSEVRIYVSFHYEGHNVPSKVSAGTKRENRLHAGLPESNYPAGGGIGYDEP